jgi:hypothetical protein
LIEEGGRGGRGGGGGGEASWRRIIGLIASIYFALCDDCDFHAS